MKRLAPFMLAVTMMLLTTVSVPVIAETALSSDDPGGSAGTNPGIVEVRMSGTHYIGVPRYVKMLTDTVASQTSPAVYTYDDLGRATDPEDWKPVGAEVVIVKQPSGDNITIPEISYSIHCSGPATLLDIQDDNQTVARTMSVILFSGTSYVSHRAGIEGISAGVALVWPESAALVGGDPWNLSGAIGTATYYVVDSEFNKNWYDVINSYPEVKITQPENGKIVVDTAKKGMLTVTANWQTLADSYLIEPVHTGTCSFTASSSTEYSWKVPTGGQTNRLGHEGHGTLRGKAWNNPSGLLQVRLAHAPPSARVENYADANGTLTIKDPTGIDLEELAVDGFVGDYNFKSSGINHAQDIRLLKVTPTSTKAGDMVSASGEMVAHYRGDITHASFYQLNIAPIGGGSDMVSVVDEMGEGILCLELTSVPPKDPYIKAATITWEVLSTSDSGTVCIAKTSDEAKTSTAKSLSFSVDNDTVGRKIYIRGEKESKKWHDVTIKATLNISDSNYPGLKGKEFCSFYRLTVFDVRWTKGLPVKTADFNPIKQVETKGAPFNACDLDLRPMLDSTAVLLSGKYQVEGTVWSAFDAPTEIYVGGVRVPDENIYVEYSGTAGSPEKIPYRDSKLGHDRFVAAIHDMEPPYAVKFKYEHEVDSAWNTTAKGLIVKVKNSIGDEVSQAHLFDEGQSVATAGAAARPYDSGILTELTGAINTSMLYQVEIADPTTSKTFYQPLGLPAGVASSTDQFDITTACRTQGGSMAVFRTPLSYLFFEKSPNNDYVSPYRFESASLGSGLFLSQTHGSFIAACALFPIDLSLTVKPSDFHPPVSQPDNNHEFSTGISTYASDVVDLKITMPCSPPLATEGVDWRETDNWCVKLEVQCSGKPYPFTEALPTSWSYVDFVNGFGGNGFTSSVTIKNEAVAGDYLLVVKIIGKDGVLLSSDQVKILVKDNHNDGYVYHDNTENLNSYAGLNTNSNTLTVTGLSTDTAQRQASGFYQDLSFAFPRVVAGEWEKIHGNLVRKSVRGKIEYDFVTGEGTGPLSMEMELTQANPLCVQNQLPLEIYVDGFFVAYQTITLPATVKCALPNLVAGSHIIRIVDNNVYSTSQPAYGGLRLVSGQAGSMPPNYTITRPGAKSRTSPACLEGTGAYPQFIKVNNQASAIGCGYHMWYANVPLTQGAPTPVEVTFENGAFSAGTSIEWAVTNVLDCGTSLNVRCGDSLLLDAFTTPQQGTSSVRFRVDDHLLEPVSVHPVAYNFATPGSHVVSATHVDNFNITTTKSVTVTVVAVSPPANPIMLWTGRAGEYAWDLPPEVVVDGRSFNYCAQIATGRFLLRRDEYSEDIPLVARLGDTNGPILAVVSSKSFWMTELDDGDYQDFTRLPDGSVLYNNRIFLGGQVPATFSLYSYALAGGVTFADGSNSLSALDFDENGIASMKIVTAPSRLGAPCHRTVMSVDGATSNIRK